MSTITSLEKLIHILERELHSIHIHKLSSTTYNRDITDYKKNKISFDPKWRIKFGRSGSWVYFSSLEELIYTSIFGIDNSNQAQQRVEKIQSKWKDTHEKLSFLVKSIEDSNGTTPIHPIQLIKTQIYILDLVGECIDAIQELQIDSMKK